MNINPLLTHRHENYLYMLNLELNAATLAQFSGVRYVVMQGSANRTQAFARQLATTILNINPNYFTPLDLTPTSHYSSYRVANILMVSHGMGNTSILGLLQDLTKLLYYAGNTQLEYIRVGTSGGIGLEAGSVVVTQQAYMPDLSPFYLMPSLAKTIQVPTNFNLALSQRIISAQPGLPFKLILGNSIAADDFYLGQARFDGALNHQHSHAEQQAYFARAQALNICNFEMESTAMAAFCNRVNIPATMIAVTLLNRLLGDQISATPEQLNEYSARSQLVTTNYLLSQEDIDC